MRQLLALSTDRELEKAVVLSINQISAIYIPILPRVSDKSHCYLKVHHHLGREREYMHMLHKQNNMDAAKYKYE